MLKNLILPVLPVLLLGCNLLPNMDEVLRDRRTEYQSSRELPPLEIPPDLTSDSINDSMAIPGDDATTLSAYEQQQRSATLGGAEAVAALPNEEVLTVSGDRYAIWPDLGRFLQEQGYTLELNDAELGVIETGWSEPQPAADGEVRGRFNIFAEPGQDADTTVLFISHLQQRRSGPEDPWVDAGNNSERQQQLVAELNRFFGGAPAAGAATAVAAADGTGTATAAGPAASVQRAELVNTEDGDVYLSLPASYAAAWDRTGAALQRVTGLEVRSADAAAGEYLVAYAPPGSEEEKGWFDALKFWADDEPPLYRLRFTGAGDRTQVVVRNEDGDGVSDTEARPLLNAIQNEYNRQS